MTIAELARPSTGELTPMAAQPPTVSVVVPCYNYAHYLEGCVRSILDQNDVDVDVLIIDDASADDSHLVACELARRESRVAVRHHAINRGHIATYNEGLALAQGSLLVLLSADDVLMPGALARAARVFAEHQRVGLVYGRVARFTDQSGPPAPRRRSGAVQLWDGAAWTMACCRNGRVPVTSPEVVVRTQLQRELGGYRADLPHSGDHEMWLRFAARTDIAFIEADQAGYRLHPASMSSRSFSSLLEDAEERKNAFQAAFDGDGSAGLHRLAMRGLAAEMLWHGCRAFDKRMISSGELDMVAATAQAMYPRAPRTAEYRRLRVRRRLGSRLAPRIAPVWVPDLVRHRVQQARREYGRLWWRHLR